METTSCGRQPLPARFGLRYAQNSAADAARSRAPARSSPRHPGRKRAQPFPEASAAAKDAAQAVIHEAGSEECLRGKLSNAIVQLSNSCDVSGLSSSACELASDIAGRELELDVAEMLTTSETLLQMLGDGASAR